MVCNKKRNLLMGVSVLLCVLFIGIYSLNKKAENKKILAQKKQEEEMQLKKEIQFKKDQELLNLKKEELKKYEDLLEDDKLMVVNKDKPLKEGYVANEIVQSGLPFTYGSANTKLNKEVAENARAMFEEAKKDGIKLLGVSAYRTNYTQRQIYNNNIRTKGKSHTEKYSAAPGKSEHETGLAIDVVSSEHRNLTKSFENTKAFKWLDNNAQKFGFILRYPKDKVGVTKYEYEPWHYRYVGVENAKEIKESGLCLDEYVNWAKQNKERLKGEIENLESKLEKNQY